jgi:hypothetical protein
MKIGKLFTVNKADLFTNRCNPFHGKLSLLKMFKGYEVINWDCQFVGAVKVV